MTRRVLVLSALLLACLPAAAAADGSATPTGVAPAPGYQPLAGPAFAGADRLAWAGPSERRGFDIHVRAPDGTVARRHVDAQGGGPLAGEVRTALAASAERIAFAVNVQRCFTENECKYMFYRLVESSVFAGPLGEPSAFHGCGAGSVGRESVDLEGTVIAYHDSCARGMVVRDLAAPAGTPWRTFPGIDAVRIAGSYVALEELPPGREQGDFRTQVAVYDWRSGERVYEVTGEVNAFDVQDDGTLALKLAQGVNGAGSLAVASPARPAPRPIGQLDAIATFRIAHSRIGIRGGDGFRILDLDGNELAAARAPDVAGGFDFDGERVAYFAQPCMRSWAMAWDLQGAPPALPAGNCPHALVTGRVARADLRRRRLAVAVRCPAEPALGCAGDWGFEVDRLRRQFEHTQFVALEPGERRTLRFRMLESQVCALARGRSRRALVRLAPIARLRPAQARGRQAVRVLSVGKPRGCRSRG